MFAYTYIEGWRRRTSRKDTQCLNGWHWCFFYHSHFYSLRLSSFSFLMCDDYDGKVNGRLDGTLLQCVEKSRSCICVFSFYVCVEIFIHLPAPLKYIHLYILLSVLYSQSIHPVQNKRTSMRLQDRRRIKAKSVSRTKKVNTVVPTWSSFYSVNCTFKRVTWSKSY